MSARGLCELGKGHVNTRHYRHLPPLQARNAKGRAKPERCQAEQEAFVLREGGAGLGAELARVKPHSRAKGNAVCIQHCPVLSWAAAALWSFRKRSRYPAFVTADPGVRGQWLLGNRNNG